MKGALTNKLDKQSVSNTPFYSALLEITRCFEFSRGLCKFNLLR